jgi:hypothetical protein
MLETRKEELKQSADTNKTEASRSIRKLDEELR